MVVMVRFTNRRLFRSDFLQQVEISKNQVSLGDEAEIQPVMPRQFFQNCARHFEAALGGLIGIGGGADRDLFCPA